MTKSKLPPLRIAPKPSGGHWTVSDWESIDFKSEEGWQTAINIFKDRITYRFLEPIRAIKNIEGSGFSIIALDCLLIETLVQFMEGAITTPRGHSGAYFQYFLTRTSFSEQFTEETADMFYKNVRCGILHQAETKGNIRITRKRTQSKIIEKQPKTTIHHIQRDLFHEKILYEFNTFIKKLRNANKESEIRLKFKRKMEDICNKYQPVKRYGILAFESLIDEPGSEILPKVTERYRCFRTPFRIEYASLCQLRDNAPTIVRLEDKRYGWAKQVLAEVLLIDPSIDENTIKDMIYRRETNSIGNKEITYDKKPEDSDITIEETKEFGSKISIFYACVKPNLQEVLDKKTPKEDRANILARHAISSVTENTFHTRRDGISYLSNAIQNKIITTLTPYYHDAILRILEAKDLEDARLIAARRQGINTTE